MKKIALTLIIVFLFTAGYTACIQRPVTEEANIYKGSKGIEMAFLPNTPPDSIFEKSDFQIVAEISNEGAYDVVNGYLTLGLGPTYVRLKNWELEEPLLSITDKDQATFNLGGKDEYNLFGERGIIAATAQAKAIEPLIASHTTMATLTVCYKYKTKANPTICIDPDIFGLRKQKACTAQDVALQDQGAPVAVTKVEIKMVPHEDKLEPQFLIYLANKGGGQIFDKDFFEKVCTAEPLKTAEDVFNKIHIKAMLSNKELNCTPALVKLTRTKKYVRCSVKKENWINKDDLAYTTVLNIELDYSYLSTIAKEVKIEKLK